MAAVTYGAIPDTVATAAKAPSAIGKPSFFRGIVERVIEGRRREAERHLRAHLLSFDSQTLARLGYDREALSRAGFKYYV